jgi:hypothetical protein
MKTQSVSLTGFIILLFLTISCDRIFIQPDPVSSPLENFDLLWREVDQKYSYFELKGIDWDQVRETFRPRVKNNMPEKELFDLLADMLFLLEDGHVNLTAGFDRSRNWDWYLNFPANYNENIIDRNYLGRDYRIAGPFRTKILPGNIGYINYQSFMDSFTESQLDDLLKSYQNTDGLIIDIRNNGGGIGALANTLASRFTSQRTIVGYQKFKNGPGRADFSRPIPIVIEPGGTLYSKPVIVLVNRQVYSAANFFASFMAQLPNVQLVGDWSGGGGGLPVSGELLNGWRYRFSTSQTFDGAMNHIENGFPPTVEVQMLESDEIQGIDTILETAIDMLREK